MGGWWGFGFFGRKSDHDLEQRFSLSAREGKVEIWEVSAEFALSWKENLGQINSAENGRCFLGTTAVDSCLIPASSLYVCI